jgi:spore germination protein KB
MIKENDGMLEKVEISNRQAMLLLIATVLPTSIFSLPMFTVAEAKEDAWISVIIASIVGVIVVLNAVLLGRKFPGKALGEYCEDILGKIPGKLAGLIFIGFFLYLTAMTTREFSEFMITVFLDDMPISILLTSIIFVCALAVFQGLEAIGRLNEVLIILVIGSFLLSLLLATGELQSTRLLPVYANGLIPILKGAIHVAGRMGEVIIIAFLVPYMDRKRLAARTGLTAVFILTALFSLTVIVAISCFGAFETGRLIFPNFMVARNIIFTDVLERVESIFMLIWVFGAFSKLTICYYVTVLTTSQWLNLTNYHSLVLPIGTVIVGISLLDYLNFSELINFLGKIWSCFALSIELGIPVILLLVAFIRRKGVKIS